MKEELQLDCNQVIKMMKEVIYSIVEPVTKSCNEAIQPYSDKSKVTMLWSDADFILDELGFLLNGLVLLERRIPKSKDEA